MGDCLSRGTKEERDKDRAIRQFLESERQNEPIKLLLLGAGDSGKSTFAKQMKIIHAGGFKAEEDRKKFATIIHKNVLACMRALIDASECFEHSIAPENEALYSLLLMLTHYVKKAVKLVVSLSDDTVEEKGIPPEVRSALKSLWKDPAIRKSFHCANEFQLPDNTDYFFSNIDRIAAADYVPSVEDILRIRSKTSGITDVKFSIGRWNFLMTDVGGQRNERKKWIHCFDNVTCLLYVVGTSEYDQTLLEDGATNRMFEALRLFRDIANSKMFKHTPIIIFYNKDDLFREKIKRVPLNVCFKNYIGDNSYEDAMRFIEDQFMLQVHNPKRLVYPFRTTAVDTANIQYIFKTVRNIFITEYLSKMGLGLLGPTAATRQANIPRNSNEKSERNSNNSKEEDTSDNSPTVPPVSTPVTTRKDIHIKSNLPPSFSDLNVPPAKLIDYNILDPMEKIGSGPFGEVFKVKLEGVYVAVKKMKVNNSFSYTACKQFANELNLMLQVRPHVNLVSIIGVCIAPTLCIVLEYVENGTLESFLQSKETMETSLAISILKGCAEGLCNLHKEGIVHRGLSSKNVLLDRNNVPKITDFGMARLTFSDFVGQTENVNPMRWLAPECVNSRHHTMRSDVWSFGCLIMSVFTRNNLTPAEVMSKVSHYSLKPTLPSGSSPKIVEIVAQCANFDPDRRWNMKQVCTALQKISEDSDTSKGIIAPLTSASKS